ncbi:MAG: hypothetical protein ACRD3W_09695 [Terriglobales bacterium]
MPARLLSTLVIILIAVAVITPAHSTLLTGGVQHADHLEPVKNALAPGKEFDKRNLPAMTDPLDANRWYQVPPWLAGRWHKENQTDFYRYDFRTNESDTTTRVQPASSDGVWGTQQDPTGQIWQFDPAPFVTTVDAGNDTVVQIVSLSQPILDTPQSFVRRSIDTQIRVDKTTNLIHTVECGEQITTYLQEESGLIKRETSAKVFDRFGQPLVLGKSFSYEKKIGPFVAENFYEGKNMREMLKKYLDKQDKLRD